jgi:hypothetical protein
VFAGLWMWHCPHFSRPYGVPSIWSGECFLHGLRPPWVHWTLSLGGRHFFHFRSPSRVSSEILTLLSSTTLMANSFNSLLTIVRGQDCELWHRGKQAPGSMRSPFRTSVFFSTRNPSGLRFAFVSAPRCESHPCSSCGKTVTESGTHGLSCQGRNLRYIRHDTVNEIISRTLTSIHVSNKVEPRGTLTRDNSRPDGITMIPWSGGRCLTWDFTCPDTLATSHISVTCQDAGAAADRAEERKRNKYAALTQHYLFAPVAIETLGAWGSGAMEFLGELGRRMRIVTGDPRSSAFLRQRIGIAVQRGNAVCISECLMTGASDRGES